MSKGRQVAEIGMAVGLWVGGCLAAYLATRIPKMREARRERRRLQAIRRAYEAEERADRVLGV